MINYTVWSYRESSIWQVNLELKFNTLPVLKTQDHILFTNIFRCSLKLRICRVIFLDTLLVRELMFARDQMMLLIDMMTLLKWMVMTFVNFPVPSLCCRLWQWIFFSLVWMSVMSLIMWQNRETINLALV